MIYLMIYLTGFVASFLLLKIGRDKEEERTWSEILFDTFVSLFSWVAILAIFICYIIEYIRNIDSNLPKPPKWL
jgi:hypothetical protein